MHNKLSGRQITTLLNFNYGGSLMKKILTTSFLFLLASIFIGTENKVNAAEFDNPFNESDTIIYDKLGNIIESTTVPDSTDEISTFSANYPDSTKWLNNGASYQSNGFSGSGRRYGGYLFNSSTTNTFKITFKKGGFAAHHTSTSAYPGNVEEYFNLPLSGLPYTMKTTKWFYFVVDNPNAGQTYHVRAIEI